MWSMITLPDICTDKKTIGLMMTLMTLIPISYKLGAFGMLYNAMMAHKRVVREEDYVLKTASQDNINF